MKYKRLILVLVSLIISLVLSELLLEFYSNVNEEFREMLRQPFSELTIDYQHPYFGHGSDKGMYKYAKNDPAEYVVLLLGGSTAAGTGASTKRKRIASRLEVYLNEMNKDPDISSYKVCCDAHAGYHTTQDKNVFAQYLDNMSDIDLLVSIDGFNNLVYPVENSLYKLQLNYPGWYWIAHQRIAGGNPSYYYLGKFLETFFDKPYIKASKLATLILNRIVHVLLGKYSKEFTWKSIIQRADKLDENSKWNIIVRARHFCREDILQMKAMADSKGIRSLFVLQPLMGLDKDELSDYEKNWLAEQHMLDTRIVPYSVIKRGYLLLQKVYAKLSKQGVDTLDLIPVFKHYKGNPYHDVVHLNDEGQDYISKYIAEYILESSK